MSQFLTAALEYAARGWPVFPLAVRGKLPMIPKHNGGAGHRDATVNEARIRSWWARWPTANVGIACDERSGLLAVDVDPRNEGDLNLAELEAQHGVLPDTVEGLTGGGGRHLLYTRPVGRTFHATLVRGVDIKANGYIVAPPSVHPDTGRAYLWEASHHPSETAIAELPSWVLTRIIQWIPEQARARSDIDAAGSLLALAFYHAGWLGQRIDRVRINVRCPWEEQHSQRSGSGGTILFAPKSGGSAGWFHCSHTSHGPKTMRDVLEAIPSDAMNQALADMCMRAANAMNVEDNAVIDDSAYERAEREAIEGEDQ